MQMEDMDYLDRASNLTMSNLLCPDRSQVPAQQQRRSHLHAPSICIHSHLHTDCKGDIASIPR